MAEQVRGIVLALQVGQTLVVRPEGLPDQIGALVGLRAHLVDVEALREGQHRLGERPGPPDMAGGFPRVQPGRDGGPLVPGVPIAEGGVATGYPADGVAHLLEDHSRQGRGDLLEVGYHGVDSASADILDEMGFDVVVAASGGQGRQDLLGRGVGHGLDVVSQGWAKLPDWPQDLLPFLERPAVAHRQDTHFGSVVRGAQAAYGVQLIGALPGEVAVEPQVLFGLRKGVEHARPPAPWDPRDGAGTQRR